MPELDLDFSKNLDFELDFDLADFDVLDTLDVPMPGEPQSRVVQPKINLREISRATCFENAEEFARQISLEPDERTYAWVNGGFVFGDIIPALITARGISPKTLYVASLSLSAVNIEGLRAVLEEAHPERMVILLSGYFYSHEKHGLIPYLYDALGNDDRVQIVFGNYHMKFISLETRAGHVLNIHGSANLRSSNSVEQVIVDQDRAIYEFNRDVSEDVAKHYGTIDYRVPPDRTKKARDGQWQAVLSARESRAR